MVSLWIISVILMSVSMTCLVVTYVALSENEKCWARIMGKMSAGCALCATAISLLNWVL